MTTSRPTAAWRESRGTEVATNRVLGLRYLSAVERSPLSVGVRLGLLYTRCSDLKEARG
jgi:hypothetical protein